MNTHSYLKILPHNKAAKVSKRVYSVNNMFFEPDVSESKSMDGVKIVCFFFFILVSLTSFSQETLLLKAKKNLFRQPDSALFYLKQSLIVNQEPETRAETYKILGIFYDIKGEYPKSESYYDSSLHIFKKLNHLEGQGDVLSNLAELFNHSDQLDKALKFGLKSMEKYSVANATNKLIAVKLNMGNYYSSFGATKKAIAYYNTVVEEENKKEKPNTLMISRAYIGLGAIYNREEKPDSALIMYDRSLNTFIQSNNLRGKAIVYNNIGNVYNKLSNYSLAIENHLQSLEIRLQLQDKSGTITASRNLAECYRKNGDLKKALKYGNNALELAKELSAPVLLRDVYYTMVGLEIDLGNKTSAHEYFDKYSILKDSLSSLERAEALAVIEEKYEDETNLRKISELELKNEKAASEKRIAIITAVFLLTTAVLIAFQFRKVRKLNHKLDKNNQALITALSDKELLLKEIHHRVKNNLQTISSLLNLQTRYVNEEAKDAVTEGRNRVKSMALIHQKLYQADNLKGILFSEYLSNLVEVLFKSYKTDHDRVALTLQIDPINLDVDTAIPLGLIVNELVSNSLKHAFPDNREGELSIELEDTQEGLRLLVKDTGTGYSLKKESKASFGMMLINTLAEKLDATIEIMSQEGTTFNLLIKNYKLA